MDEEKLDQQLLVGLEIYDGMSSWFFTSLVTMPTFSPNLSVWREEVLARVRSQGIQDDLRVVSVVPVDKSSLLGEDAWVVSLLSLGGDSTSTKQFFLSPSPLRLTSPENRFEWLLGQTTFMGDPSFSAVLGMYPLKNYRYGDPIPVVASYECLIEGRGPFFYNQNQLVVPTALMVNQARLVGFTHVNPKKADAVGAGSSCVSLIPCASLNSSVGRFFVSLVVWDARGTHSRIVEVCINSPGETEVCGAIISQVENGFPYGAAAIAGIFPG